MSWTNKVILSVVDLTVYLILLPIIIYTAYCHRRYGKIGHLFLFIYILLRIITDALSISDRNEAPSVIALILNSIGISPLLLATAGFVNKARAYIHNYGHNKEEKKLGIVFELILHIITITGIALLASGSSKAAQANNVSKDHIIADIGVLLLLLSWIIIAFWTLMLYSQQRSKSVRNLLVSVALSEIFLFVRVIYTVIYTFSHSAKLSPGTSSFGIEFALIFLVQLFTVTSLVVGLILSRKIDRTLTGAPRIELQQQIVKR